MKKKKMMKMLLVASAFAAGMIAERALSGKIPNDTDFPDDDYSNLDEDDNGFDFGAFIKSFGHNEKSNDDDPVKVCKKHAKCGSGSMFVSKHVKADMGHNAVVFGASGTGKTKRFIEHIIGAGDRNYIVFDPDGEIVADSALIKEMVEAGYEILIFDTHDPKVMNAIDAKAGMKRLLNLDAIMNRKECVFFTNSDDDSSPNASDILKAVKTALKKEAECKGSMNTMVVFCEGALGNTDFDTFANLFAKDNPCGFSYLAEFDDIGQCIETAGDGKILENAAVKVLLGTSDEETSEYFAAYFADDEGKTLDLVNLANNMCAIIADKTAVIDEKFDAFL